MLHTTTHAQRLEMIERHLAGESLPAIAAALQLNSYTVRKFWRIYQQHGWTGLQVRPPGPARRGPLGTAHPRLKYVLLRLKRQHRGWGVDKLRLELTRRPSLQSCPIPQRSALAAYLARFGTRLRQHRRKATQRPQLPAPVPPCQPHECWQMDFKGDEAVAGCGLRIAPFFVCERLSEKLANA